MTVSKYLSNTNVLSLVVAAVSVVITNAPTLLVLVIMFYLPIDVISDVCLHFINNRPLSERLFLIGLFLMVQGVVYLFPYAIVAGELGQVMQGERALMKNALGRVAGPTTIALLGTLLLQTALVLWPFLALVFGGAIVALLGVVFLRSEIWLLLYVIILVAGAIVTIYRGINFTLMPWVAIFEAKYYMASAKRSKEIVTGRRVWLFFILFIQLVLTVGLTIGASEGLTKLTHITGGIEGGFRGFGIEILECIFSSFVVAVSIAFDTLIYFRLRREKSDLTFFTMSDTELLRPARLLVDASAAD